MSEPAPESPLATQPDVPANAPEAGTPRAFARGMTDEQHRPSDSPDPDELEADRPPRPSQAEGDDPDADSSASPDRPPRPSQAEGDR